MDMDKMLTEWLHGIDISNIQETCEYLKELGITKLEHFKEFDLSSDIGELHLKKLEERRFKLAYESLRDNAFQIMQPQV